MADQNVKFTVTTSADTGAITATGNAAKEMASSFKLATEAAKELGEAAKGAQIGLKEGFKLEAGAEIVRSIKEIAHGFEEAIAQGVEFNKEVETLRNNLAGAFVQQEGLGLPAALAASDKTLDTLKSKANDLGLDFVKLGEAYAVNLGALIKGGVKDTEEQINVIIRLQQAIQSKGITGNQATRDLIDILQGVGDRTLAGKELGLTSEVIKAAEAAGKLGDVVTEKTKGIAAVADLTKQSFANLSQTLQNEIQQTLGTAAEPVFDSLKAGIIALNEELKKPEVADALRTIGIEVAHVVDKGGELLKWALDNAGALAGLAQAAITAGVAYAGFKIIETITGFLLKQTTALIADTVATEANTAAKIANKAANAGGAGGGAAAGAAGAAGSSLAGIFGAVNIGVGLGLVANLAIQSYTAHIEELAKELDKAGAAQRKFEDTLKDTARGAPTEAEGKRLVEEKAQTEINRLQKEYNDLTKDFDDEQKGYFNESQKGKILVDQIDAAQKLLGLSGQIAKHAQDEAKARKDSKEITSAQAETLEKQRKEFDDKAFKDLPARKKLDEEEAERRKSLSGAQDALRKAGVPEDAVTNAQTAKDINALGRGLSGKSDQATVQGFANQLQEIEERKKKSADIVQAEVKRSEAEDKRFDAEIESANRALAKLGIGEDRLALKDNAPGKAGTAGHYKKDGEYVPGKNAIPAKIDPLRGEVGAEKQAEVAAEIKKRNDAIDGKTKLREQAANERKADAAEKEAKLLEGNPVAAAKIAELQAKLDKLSKDASGSESVAQETRDTKKLLADTKAGLDVSPTGAKIPDPLAPFGPLAPPAPTGLPASPSATNIHQDASSSLDGVKDSASEASKAIADAAPGAQAALVDLGTTVTSALTDMVASIKALKAQVADQAKSIAQLNDDQVV